jgi:hypothetical protein
MSAAIAQPCVVCYASSSKYKCPTCRDATCSLACSKQHAAQRHIPRNSVDTNKAISSSSYTKRLLPSLHLRNETIEAPQAHRFSKVDKYVGLKEYDSKQLMEDFEYLQYLGKCVTSLGRDITKHGWMKDESVQKPNQQQGGTTRGGHANHKNANTFHQHVSAEVKNRQTFESWIRKMRLPIMLVPDGMSLRKENQTRWKNNTKQLLCTVEIRFPSTSTKSRSLLHHILWDKQISEVVLKEVEKKGKQKSKTAGEAPDDVMTFCEGVSMDKWSDSLCIAVSVSNDRLRNESSSKFLEWWQRQVKNGMVKEDGLQFDEEKKGALEQIRSGAWAAIEGMERAEGWPAAEEIAEQSKLEAEANIESGGLISSMLLEKMQAARAMKAERDATSSTPGHGAGNAKDAPTSTLTRRSLIILEGKETFQEVLQSLTKGLAIVEYFHIEVWTKKALMEQIKSKIVIRERLEGRSEGDEDLQTNLGKHRQEEHENIAAVQMKKAKTTNSSSNALGSLTAYASSDEEDEEEHEEGEEQNSRLANVLTEVEPEASGGLAEMARLLGMVPS